MSHVFSNALSFGNTSSTRKFIPIYHWEDSRSKAFFSTVPVVGVYPRVKRVNRGMDPEG
jgi:hypothetical protein